MRVFKELLRPQFLDTLVEWNGDSNLLALLETLLAKHGVEGDGELDEEIVFCCSRFLEKYLKKWNKQVERVRDTLQLEDPV